MLRILGVDDLPAKVSICDSAVDIGLMENKTQETTLNVCLVSHVQIMDKVDHGSFIKI